MLLPKWAALFLCFVLLGSFMIATVQAAPGGPGANDAVLLTQLASASGATPQVFRHAETDKVRFLELPPAHPLSAAPSLLAPSPEQAARAFLTSYGSLFGISAPAQELQLMQQETLPGRNFVRFQQHYQGVPVMGGELIVQSDAQRAVVSASGEALPDLSFGQWRGAARPEPERCAAHHCRRGRDRRTDCHRQSVQTASGRSASQRPTPVDFQPGLAGWPRRAYFAASVAHRAYPRRARSR